MCRAATCRECGKTTWAGCGQHVEEVLRSVPRAQRCQGHEKPVRTGFLSRLLGGDGR